MNKPSRDESPDFTFYDDDGRGRITQYTTENAFRLGDWVYLVKNGQKTGPFKIETVPGPKRYTLCLQDGTPVNNGQEVDEKDLEKQAPP
ncbi:hypothetical protein F5Y03DRAFT_359551 [Xylaria venustula]|nr:hypothetical protein F5Y03DRAFT_359551 [Xylaria venustula]